MSEQSSPGSTGDLSAPEALNISDQDRIVRHLRHQVLQRITGAEGERVRTDFPRDRYFAGTLAAESSEELGDFSDDLQSKMKPSALGATVRLRDIDPDDTMAVDISGAVWIRVNPTYEELQNADEFVSLGDTEEEADSEADEDDREELIEVFERFELSVPTIEIPVEDLLGGTDGTPERVTERAAEAIRIAFQNVQAEAEEREDISLFRIAEDGVSQSALEDRAAYDAYLEDRSGEVAIPEWDASLSVSATTEAEADTLKVDLEFANEAQITPSDSRYTRRDPTLFEVEMELVLEGTGSFVPFTFDPLPEDFRYNRGLWGHGRNCTVVAPEKPLMPGGQPPGRSAAPVDPTADRLRTEYLPEYRQFAYASADRGLDTSFASLADLEGGGYERLEDVLEEMREYRDTRYAEALEEYRARSDWNRGDGDGRGGNDEEDFQQDREKFEREIRRFERGVESLREHPDMVGRAFELMNETMDEMHEFDGWRLFQLVFIVMLIPDIASREHDEYIAAAWREDSDIGGEQPVDAQEALDIVDVLWFPTGGGKTEAFLGTAIWNAFFDRIRGKDFGVTAWTRFPLRLLSLQQLQRMAETMMYADLVRRQEDDIGGPPNHPFSVGFLVGKRNTPNSLTGFNNNKADELRKDDERREDLKVLANCPECGSDISMRVTDDHRLAHVCTGSDLNCSWQQRELDQESPYAVDELPVHVVDNELYRYAPTILAGTIDKITATGYQRKMAHLLTGKMEYECPIHGFASLGECTEKYGCDIDKNDFENMATPVEPKDPAPSLEVPDELHLLEESVGSFDGHYETAVQELQEIEDAGKTKVVAPTATITAFEDQVYHLFLRNAERFPAPGPYLRENFYAEQKPDLQRYYIGITPHGKTHINSIIDLLFHYHRAIQDLLDDAVHQPDELLDGSLLEPADSQAPLDVDSEPELLDLLGKYTTSLTYLLSRKDGDRLDQSIDGQLANYFQTEGRPPLNADRMTGGTKFEEIQDILDVLENPWKESSDSLNLERLIDQGIIDQSAEDEIEELVSVITGCLHDDAPASTYRDALERSSDEARTGLAWLLASRKNSITATSMISHGVDVERFNMMVFFGMPRQTAEYIQSSSRAGRDHPGLIFNVFHPIRERDRSHYHFFEKYHEFLDRLVEPVAINRWAKNSVHRTHPGLFMSLLLKHYMYEDQYDRLFFGSEAKKLIQNIDEDALADTIEAMYGGEAVPTEFAATARELTGQAASQIQLNDDEKWTSNRLQRSVMTSLRDVDEQLPIRATYDSRDLFETLDRRR
jgi:hypothetical protein